jgi:acetoacetyl-CoA synthetase
VSVLWQPTPERVERSTLTAFRRWLDDERGLAFDDYGSLWRWSVDELEQFWACVWDYFALGQRGETVLERRVMPGARWFEGTHLNYAERALAHDPERIAIEYEREDGARRTMTFGELRAAVGGAANVLRTLGVGRGDRVAAVVPNSPDAVVALLATASLGAVWTSCSPEFGADSVVVRFAQVEPKVLIAVDSYCYGGREHRTAERAEEIRARLPSVRALVACEELAAESGQVDFEAVPFDHPLWILYSSGTTGPPKAIVHGHGGITISALKDLGIQFEVGPGERFFRYTTPTWVMWNVLASGLLTGATIVLYDGHPLHPDAGVLWRLAGRLGVTNFGAGAAWIEACIRDGVEPAEIADLSRLHTVASTGSPLSAEGYRWLYEHVGEDLHVASNCGGTDVCGPLLGSCALLPVRAGEIQTRPLGVSAEAWDEHGRSLVDEIGELVVTEPMPSMPLYLWNDRAGERLAESYFKPYPGIWRHGDWVRITPDGGAVVYGRSDATLNRGGVRMGTAEFYNALEFVPGVRDAIVVDTSAAGAGGELILLTELSDDVELDDALRDRIRAELRVRLSPRHIPDRILAIAAVPYTVTGKKCEVPVKRLLQGAPPEQVVARESLRNPESLDSLLEVVAQCP